MVEPVANPCTCKIFDEFDAFLVVETETLVFNHEASFEVSNFRQNRSYQSY